MLQFPQINKTPDYQGIADYFHFGQILGRKTLFEGIKLMPPGSVLTFDGIDFKTSLHPYWHLKNLFVKKGEKPVAGDPEPVVDHLIASIKSRCEQPEKIGLSLSGGLDSRGILAGMGSLGRGISTYTLGLPGCADERLAAKMAAVAGTSHEFIPLDQAYIDSFDTMANEMIRLSDGMYPPHESTEMLALNYFKSADFSILLRGHGGEIAKAALAYPVMVRPEVQGLNDSRSALHYILDQTNLVLRDMEPARLFLSDIRGVMEDTPKNSLKDSCGGVSEVLTPADLCIYYYIHEHIRRQVVSSLDIFRTCMEIRMPYVDERFIHSLLQLPLFMRNQGEIHHMLVKKCMPELMKIPNSNTGAPMDAGPIRLFVTDKVTSLMKKLSIKGFRHYTEFEKWHREGFQKSSRAIIFSERSRTRGLYNMGNLEALFQMHVSGKKDYARLLGTVVGLELWFRNFVD